MHFFPVYFKGMVELQAVESDIIFLVVLIQELVGEFTFEVLDIVSTLHPADVFGLLEIVAEYVRLHSLG